MEELIREYREALKQVNQMRDESTDPGDRAVLGGIIRDLQYAIRWMRSGREPGSVRGIERRAAYQREVLVDPIYFQEYYSQPLYQQEEHSLSNWQMAQVEDALSVLSPREKEVYMMSRGQCLSYAEIAGLLGVSKGTIQKMIERAEKKMMRQKETSLFFVG